MLIKPTALLRSVLNEELVFIKFGLYNDLNVLNMVLLVFARS